MTVISEQVSRRRSFAIISHPDAGKTTLTEKLLLFGGALQFAGAVRAKGNQRRSTSDWMKIEQQRGISVMTSVMTFDYSDHILNLLDTPGHEDFCEDTYRTLSAVDSAIMVIDAARGIEARTLKLFEVCRLRDIPIITFINKMDRESLDPFALLDDIEKTLALDVTPFNWPVGQGHCFAGVYDLTHNHIRLKDHDDPIPFIGVDDPVLSHLSPETKRSLPDEISLAREACRSFDMTSYREGHLSPVLFGSALRDTGVRDLIETIVSIAPPPQPQTADKREVEPDESSMTGFVFKIQANMDPNHRDRIAFMRISSGTLKRGMKARVTRTGKLISLHTPQFFFAQERALADAAFAGDVVGIPNHGILRIGDTLTEGEELIFSGVPSFAPEILRRVRLQDAMRAKKMREAMQQLAEEGVIQVFTPLDGAPPIIGVVGALQLDVLIARMANEYRIPIELEATRFQITRWISSFSRVALDRFMNEQRAAIATDLDGAPVFMAESQFMLRYVSERSSDITFHDVKSYQKKIATE